MRASSLPTAGSPSRSRRRAGGSGAPRPRGGKPGGRIGRPGAWHLPAGRDQLLNRHPRGSARPDRIARFPDPVNGAKPPFRSRETATAVIALPPSLTARGLAPDPELRPSGGIGAGLRRAGRRCPRRHRVKVGGHHPAGTRVARQLSALRAWNHGDAGCRGPWMSPSSRSSAITWTGTAMATGRSGRNTPVPWPSRGDTVSRRTGQAPRAHETRAREAMTRYVCNGRGRSAFHGRFHSSGGFHDGTETKERSSGSAARLPVTSRASASCAQNLTRRTQFGRSSRIS